MKYVRPFGFGFQLSISVMKVNIKMTHKASEYFRLKKEDNIAAWYDSLIIEIRTRYVE